MDRKKIAGLVNEKAENIVKRIGEELRSLLKSWKINIASRLDRAVLGINVQFIEGDLLQIKTLAMSDFSSAHTAANIQTMNTKCFLNLI